MSVIPCRECRKPSPTAICSSCRRARYGRAHQADRARWAPKVNAGEVDCCRCAEPIEPDPTRIGGGWDLDHRPDGSKPAHDDCNRRAGARSMP